MENLNYLPVTTARCNMPDYDEACRHFRWEEAEKSFSWYKTGRMNIAYECIDRHCEQGKQDKVALYYTSGCREEAYTFADLKKLSNRFANVLNQYGIGRGDRVFILMPRQPELYYCFFGILKTGAIVSPLFESFRKFAVTERMGDAEAVAVITTPQMLSRIERDKLPSLKHIFLVDAGTGLKQGEIDVAAAMSLAADTYDIQWMNREDGMLLNYTSGAHGRAKGVFHVHDVMVQLYQTSLWVLDLRDDDVYWCTADPGWITGSCYGILGPWLLGTSIVVRGGKFSPQGWYSLLEKYRVSVWYTAPTAYRMLMAAGSELAESYNLSSLRHLISVGEALNPEVIYWAKKIWGQRIHDTWWMTETGGQMICNYPGMPIKPGSMGKPFPGIRAAIVDKEGKELGANRIGQLAIEAGWPGMMRGIWRDTPRYQEYFAFTPWYLSGDSAYQDEDGYFWFQGRMDDVINTSGERVGPSEVEAILTRHPAVKEAGVIGKADPLRGEIIKAYLVLSEGYVPSDKLAEDIRTFVGEQLFESAAPREIEFHSELPRDKSGKIIRQVLKSMDAAAGTRT